MEGRASVLLGWSCGAVPLVQLALVGDQAAMSVFWSLKKWDASSGVRVTVPSSDRSGFPPLLKYGTPSLATPKRKVLS